MFSDVFVLGVLVLCLAVSDIFKTYKINELEDEVEGLKDELISVVKQTEGHLNQMNEKIYKIGKGEKQWDLKKLVMNNLRRIY